MPGHRIKCPYCFKSFNDEDVHFRMETIFTEDNLDPLGEQRTREEIEMDSRYTNDEIRRQLAEYELRERFVRKDDEKYEAFWREFGGTTEKSSVSRDGKTPTVMPYHRPVYDPGDPGESRFFRSPENQSDVINENGLIYAAIDCFGRKTERRVCPHCHNPLPGAYGKYPVKFIPVIGISGAGKTVYLSQLCKYISKQLSYYGITVNPTSIYASEYLQENPIVMGKPLPIGTPPEQLLQPLCFDCVYRQEDREFYHTLVFYDIAGENCVSVEKIKGFGRFVENADSIILLIDPEQFSEAGDKAQPVLVLETIYNLFQNRGRAEVKNMPIAVCISKADKIAFQLMHQNLDDVQPLYENDDLLPVFNAEDYNQIYDPINAFVRANDNELLVHLRNLYDNYNYFLFSAIGTSVKKIEGTDLDTPAGPTRPMRIIEPIAWLLYKYRFIGIKGEIHEPKDWMCPTCGKRRRVNTFCPECRTNNKGEWLCPKCGQLNTGEWCTTPKCKTNRFGKRKGIFSK